LILFRKNSEERDEALGAIRVQRVGLRGEVDQSRHTIHVKIRVAGLGEVQLEGTHQQQHGQAARNRKIGKISRCRGWNTDNERKKKKKADLPREMSERVT